MQYPAIQQLCIRLSGFFDYNITAFDTSYIEQKFGYDTYFDNNEKYFNQKYYHNWLQTLYPKNSKLQEIGIPFLKGNHLVLKDVVAAQHLESKGQQYSFTVNSVDVYLFRENLGIFSIDILPHEKYRNFEDISIFANLARNITNNPIIEIIDKHVLSLFSKNSNSWHAYNPHLKLFLNIDVNENFTSSIHLDNLLFELASVAPVGSVARDELFSPSEFYYSKILENNTIHIFRNWKAICLSDSLVRISVNLKTPDTHRLWDNDYYAIYVFTLFIRFYLYTINRQLSENFNLKKSKNISEISNDYMGFMNEFDLTQISYKFLPNEIYKKLLSSLEVTDELCKLDQKIIRIDKYKNEVQEKRLKMLERYLLVATIFLISWEGGELLNLIFFGHHQEYHRIIAALLFATVIILSLVIYFFIGKKK